MCITLATDFSYGETQPESPSIIRTNYHLTARPWKPLGIFKDQYLDVIEGLCRYSIRHQDGQGAIIDPYLNREHSPCYLTMRTN